MTLPSLLDVPGLAQVAASIVRAEVSRSRRTLFWGAELDLAAAGVLSDGPARLSREELRAAADAFAELCCIPPGEIEAMTAEPLDGWALRGLFAIRDRGADLVFRTSGSTGEPVRCAHPIALLEQESSGLAGLFPGRRRVVCLVPQHHIYGFLFGVLLPRALAAPVLAVPPIPGALGEVAQTGDLILAFPLFWSRAAESGMTFPPDVLGVTSTGPCPAQVILELFDRGLARMTEVYGSSETGGIGTRHHPESPYVLMPHWTRVAAQQGDGPDHSSLARTLPCGGAGPAVALPDELVWHGERCFLPAGRRDKAVQVAGVNVYPDRVAQVLAQHPQVRECAVRPMRPEEGDRLKAFVVLAEGVPVKGKGRELQEWLAARLASAEVPRGWFFGPQLPHTSLGKLSDW